MKRHRRMYPVARLTSAGMTPDEIAKHGGTIDGSHAVFKLDDAGMTALADRLDFVKRSPAYSDLKRDKLPDPLPRSDWPMLVRVVARFATDDDKGVGDTVKRAAKMIGAEMVTKVLKAAGVECGCNKRRAWMNARYPYP